MMNKKLVGLTLALVLPAFAFAGGDADAGKSAFEDNCSECHYQDDFAGDSEADILEAIKAASEDSEHPGDLSVLTEEDVANLAAHFAAAGGE